jgi:hypothetical protein
VLLTRVMVKRTEGPYTTDEWIEVGDSFPVNGEVEILAVEHSSESGN